MDLYLNELEDDINKYNDIGFVYEKLKNNENFKKLKLNLIEIFKEESNFAFTELKNIAKKEKNIDLNEQFNLNYKIFKSNLQLIINSLSIIISK